MRKKTTALRAIDVFSCIGGHALGLQAAGIDVVGLCEIHPQRRAFLQQKFPHIKVHDDIRTCDAVRGAAHILTGGPPCQETSVGAAIHGKRSGRSLWAEMLRFAHQGDFEWIVVEQPPGNEEWESKVCQGLGSIGRHSTRVELSARDLGAPHIRKRVFILAHADIARLAFARSAIPREVERFKGSAVAGNLWLEGPPRALRVVNGISGWLDRNAAVEAIGDSNPPGMMTVIGRAILQAKYNRLDGGNALL